MNRHLGCRASLFLVFWVGRAFARECMCVHDGVALPIDQHPSKSSLPGGTCVHIQKDHVHFREANWTLVVYEGHHAFVEEIRTEYDRLECDEHNTPLTTTTTESWIKVPQQTTSITTTVRPTLQHSQTTATPSSVNASTPASSSSSYCSPLSGAPSNVPFSCPGLGYMSRTDWGAATNYETLNDLTKTFNCAKDFVIIYHTFGEHCNRTDDCVRRLQTDIQTWKNRQFNFALGEDGVVYELNGFSSVAKHAGFFDSISLGVVFIGDYSKTRPSVVSVDSLKKFLSCAVHQNHISPGYILRTEKDISGNGLADALYTEISSLPHY